MVRLLRRRPLGVLVLVLGLAVAAVPAHAGVDPGPAAPARAVSWLDPGLPLDGPPQRVVVTGAAAAEQVRRAGGVVTAELPLVDGVAATVPARRLAALAAADGVLAVTADREAPVLTQVWDETATASTFTRTTRATSLWTRGAAGQGVGVAVLDTGVSPMADLAGRLVHGPDLSGEGTFVDTFGHGTVMAGLVAGDGAGSSGRTGGAWTGMAPAAHVVSVKVAGRNGVVDVSTVLQAMHWVSAYRAQLGIRVLNLSWGVPSTQHHSVDPLNHAVQRLWSEGVVVVVAAGNSGPTSGTITKPADDPVVLTVGAYNEQGDLDPANDGVSGWSSRGPTSAGVAKPDLVAPGRSLVALRSPGSAVEAENPRSLVAPAYIRGSGTSQAAAVTSGAAALLLSARPELTPDQVKAALTSTAVPIPGVGQAQQGSGRLDVDAASAAVATTAAQPITATGLGSLEGSRGGINVVAECDGVQREIRGEIDVRCQPWDAARWVASSWSGDAWTGVAWKGAEWTGVAWKGVAWKDATWSASSWSGGTWDGGSWFGERGWNGDPSPTSAWSGVAWKASSWSGVAWKASSWSGGTWTSAEYDGFQSAFWGASPPPGRRLAGEPYTPVRGGVAP